MTVSTEASRFTDESLRSRHFKMLIDGELLEGSSSQSVIDPATEEVIATAPVASAEQVDQAVSAAKKAFASWKETTTAHRAALIHELADAVESRKEEIARVITFEAGKPIGAARADVDLSLTWVRHVAGVSLDPLVIRDDEASRIELRYKPVGVVAAIVPWNFPFFQTMYKIAPALLAGNTVVVKPAPTTPLNAMILAEILQKVMPAGVINIVGDGGNVGPQLAAHPDVSKVSFTGSTAAGRKVMASGAEGLKRIVLELGGNDAAIVMDDAVVEKAAKGIFTWAFMNTGQVCINIKRIYVPSAMYEEFCSAFAALARQARIGHGLDPETDFGPIQNARQYETARQYLELAREHGTVIAGGSAPEGLGYFIEPTVVRDIDETSPLVLEETFGPIRTIMKYDDIDDAIRRVNDTQYGLGNSVWGENLERAAAVADRLESGTTWVNTHFALAPDVPFGGRKQSGMGVEFGLEGILEFTENHVINISKD